MKDRENDGPLLGTLSGTLLGIGNTKIITICNYEGSDTFVTFHLQGMEHIMEPFLEVLMEAFLRNRIKPGCTQ